MAEIGIQEKRGGSSWIWWVIGLVILALVIWWFVGMKDRDGDANVGAVTTVPSVVETAPAMGIDGNAGVANGPVTDLTTLTGATSASELTGRQVVLTGVPVASVVSDKGFWVGNETAAGNELFVVRGNQNAAYTAPDGAVDAGKSVNIYGTVQAMPADLTAQSATWNLKSTDSQRLSGRPIYISADSVRIASR